MKSSSYVYCVTKPGPTAGPVLHAVLPDGRRPVRALKSDQLLTQPQSRDETGSELIGILCSPPRRLGRVLLPHLPCGESEKWVRQPTPA